jgi:hypothetical protein
VKQNSPPSYDNENEAAPSYDMDDNKAYQLDKKDALRDYEGVGDSAVGREDGQTSKQGRRCVFPPIRSSYPPLRHSIGVWTQSRAGDGGSTRS